MNKQFIIIFLLLILSATLCAQRYISGRVADAETDESITGASVFIAGTTVGTTTDAAGNYMLRIPGEGSYRLTVSHVGYQSEFNDIESGNVSMTIHVALKSNIIEEVTISARVRFRQRDINLFWRTLLGKPPSRRTIYAVNPEDVFYYYNSETQTLRVTCRTTLQIVNMEMGYNILLMLDHFVHHYSTTVSTWKGECMFIELEPENDRQKDRWEANRRKAYQSSLRNFIRSLYRNNLAENGFLLTYPAKLDKRGNPRDALLHDPTIFLVIDSIGGRKTIQVPQMLDDLMLVCFDRPVDRDLLHLVDIVQNGKESWTRIGLFRNVLQTPEGPVHIFADGTYRNALQLSPEFSSNSLMGLASTLPADFNPDGDSDAFATVSVENELSKRFDQQLKIFPQEKIYLHTDKPHYVSGDRIWFRAHVADAATHFPVSYSPYVYVELFNPDDSVVFRVKIREDGGAYHGFLPIPDDTPEGDYTIRAYTAYMLHLDEHYLSTKPVSIIHPRARAEVQNPASDEDFDVVFYPEGGSLMQGVSCMVAFKSLKTNGQSANISGVVYDREGNEIQRFESEHSGMGRFWLLSAKGKSYYAVCRNEAGITKRFEIPAAAERGYALSLSQSTDSIYVSALKPAESTQADELYLLAHTRGMTRYINFLDHARDIAVIEKELFPSGVLHFILFDADMNPLSERLMFINHQHEHVHTTYFSDEQNFTPRSLVKKQVMLTDSSGDPLTGNFSVSVTSDSKLMSDAVSNIMSELLLSSDLRGYIENPAYYFQNSDHSFVALDLLMCTQGWRRYDIAELARGRFDQPELSVESGMKISGSVKNISNEKAVHNVEVTAVSYTSAIFNSVRTDRDGRFSIPVGETPDSTLFMVSADPKRRMTRMKMTIDDEIFPVRTLTAVRPTKMKREQIENYAERLVQPFAYESDIDVYELSEVTITAQRITPRKSHLYAHPDVSVTEEELNKLAGKDIYDVLRNLPGVQVDGHNITIRGRTLLNLNESERPRPLVLLDNMPMDIGKEKPTQGNVQKNTSILEMISIHDIAQIDILSSVVNTAIFGSIGGQGVIAIYTKNGINSGGKINPIAAQTFHSKALLPLGFQQPVEFYAPKYDTPEKRNAQTPDTRATIHWQPVVQTYNRQGVASFEFYTADEQDSYTAVIEGLTDDGKIISKVEKFWGRQIQYKQ